MSTYNPQNPLIVQSDRTLLLEVESPLYEACREAVATFAELEKSPEHIHTYRITPLSLWNARATGMEFAEMQAALSKFSKFEVPQSLLADIRDLVSRYGRLALVREGERLILKSDDRHLIAEIWAQRRARALFREQLSPLALELPLLNRGRVKQALLKLGWPVEDLAGYTVGQAMEIALRDQTLRGKPFGLREYQVEAVENFWVGGTERGGSGVLVLPCGAGKTVIGIAAMAKAQMQTLILATGITAARQWRDEILDKTDLTPEMIAEYSGEDKSLAPVTIATYQVMTYRKGGKKEKKEDEEDLANFPHLALFSAQNWGLIIYDEVHLLPAPVFRMTAEIQAKRRLGLTATLVREDGREDDVFSLIGPKKYDVPWRVLEKQGWIAEAICTEIRVPMDEEKRMDYAVSERREKYRIASTNAVKLYTVDRLLRRHENDNVLIIGQYLDQLEQISKRYNAPMITGKTPNREREQLYAAFRRGEEKLLVVSKVANFAIDLPDANVAIQVSGTFGSRQEEAQRLGRVLRPKGEGVPAHFYSIVTRDTVDQDFGVHRQLFLTEQGYRYEILDEADLFSPDEVEAAGAKLIG
ncbi:MAG: box helicase [Armatimonadetes bacterium]|jgi:DNA excision repair protein ERCC-3|nr:box helicase [Armatimonadota bacterium]